MHTARRLLATSLLLLGLSATAACGEDPATQPSAGAGSSTTAAPSSPSSEASARQKPRSPRPASGATLSITVSGDDVSPVAETISMSAGDVLTLRITSDRPGELHVHSSPEQYVDFDAGETRRDIEIQRPGQVDVEEHDTGALVARLLVR